MPIMALVICMLNSSCSSEDVMDTIMGNDEYFIVLDDVSSNLIDASGKSLDQAIYDEFQFDKGGKSQSLGKSDAAPIKVFEESCSNIQSALQTAYNGKMPEGGWITYNFSLRKDSSTGKIQLEKSITIK